MNANANIAVGAICADSEERTLALRRDSGDEHLVADVIGTPEQCRDALHDLRDRFGLDEILLLDLCADYRDKSRSYRLLADVMGIAGVPS